MIAAIPPDQDGAQQCDPAGRLPAPPFLASFSPGLDRFGQNALGIVGPDLSLAAVLGDQGVEAVDDLLSQLATVVRGLGGDH